LRPIADSPKPPPQRITFTFPLINAARNVAFIATGAAKQSPLQQIFESADCPLPAALVKPATPVVWFVDSDAVGWKKNYRRFKMLYAKIIIVHLCGLSFNAWFCCCCCFGRSCGDRRRAQALGALHRILFALQPTLLLRGALALLRRRRALLLLGGGRRQLLLENGVLGRLPLALKLLHTLAKRHQRLVGAATRRLQRRRHRAFAALARPVHNHIAIVVELVERVARLARVAKRRAAGIAAEPYIGK
jgi:hypothetical protein